MGTECKNSLFCNDVSIMLDSEYDGKIISSIISYLYSDKKTAYQISKHLRIHQIQVIMYLEYLLKEGIINCTEENLSYGSDKFYYVSMDDSKIETKISSNKNEICRLASEFGKKVNELIVNLKPNDINNISYTVAMVSEDDVQVLIDAQKKIEVIMSKMENKSKQDGKKVNKYIMVSLMTPYKIGG